MSIFIHIFASVNQTSVIMRKKTSHREKDFGLVQRALCGDQDAFTTIFKKYNVILTIQIGEIINDKDLTADIVMETFEKALSGWNASNQTIN